MGYLSSSTLIGQYRDQFKARYGSHVMKIFGINKNNVTHTYFRLKTVEPRMSCIESTKCQSSDDTNIPDYAGSAVELKVQIGQSSGV